MDQAVRELLQGRLRRRIRAPRQRERAHGVLVAPEGCVAGPEARVRGEVRGIDADDPLERGGGVGDAPPGVVGGGELEEHLEASHAAGDRLLERGGSLRGVTRGRIELAQQALLPWDEGPRAGDQLERGDGLRGAPQRREELGARGVRAAALERIVRPQRGGALERLLRLARPAELQARQAEAELGGEHVAVEAQRGGEGGRGGVGDAELCLDLAEEDPGGDVILAAGEGFFDGVDRVLGPPQRDLGAREREARLGIGREELGRALEVARGLRRGPRPLRCACRARSRARRAARPPPRATDRGPAPAPGR